MIMADADAATSSFLRPHPYFLWGIIPRVKRLTRRRRAANDDDDGGGASFSEILLWLSSSSSPPAVLQVPPLCAARLMAHGSWLIMATLSACSDRTGKSKLIHHSKATIGSLGRIGRAKIKTLQYQVTYTLYLCIVLLFCPARRRCSHFGSPCVCRYFTTQAKTQAIAHNNNQKRRQ